MWQWHSEKVCGTCANWGGNRTTKAVTPGCAYTDEQSSKGECYIRRQNKQANDWCTSWQKWPGIR